MHGKLLFAVIFIALTHILGAKAKKQSQTGTLAVKGVPILLSLLLIAGLVTSYFGVAKPF